MVLIKTKKNKKGELEEKLGYPIFSPDDYLKYQLYDENNLEKKNDTICAHRLFGMVFNDNTDIFRNTDCDHIDRFYDVIDLKIQVGLHHFKFRIIGNLVVVKLIENIIKKILNT
jgi:hypothetical protein